jgi:hypothetical protein
MRLVVNGSFNCPCNFLPSRRVDRLIDFGAAEVEWRAVVHDPDVPVGGLQITDELAMMFDCEFEAFRGLLCADDPYPSGRPIEQPNKTLAVAAYATTTGGNADRMRAAIFDTSWIEGRYIGDQTVLRDLNCPTQTPGDTMHRRRETWLAFERLTIPMMVLPDGTVSQGLGSRIPGSVIGGRSPDRRLGGFRPSMAGNLTGRSESISGPGPW